MKLLRVLPIVLVSLTLSGHVIAAKPEMSAERYTSFARSFVVMEYCIWKGWITSDVAALGKRYLDNNIQAYTVNLDRFNSEAALINENAQKPDQGDCNRLAVAIRDRQQTIQANNQSDAYNQQQMQEFIISTRISNTSCNRIGTQTFCSTY